jgi:nucleoside 2-deoxyribosyltransferase
MKLYLAAAFSRHEEIAAVAKQLKKLGVDVTSSWLKEETRDNPSPEFLRERAYIDLRDIAASDGVVRFSDFDFENKPIFFNNKLLTGARHFEFGYAKALGKSLYMVGLKQNVFDHLDGVTQFYSIEEMLNHFSEVAHVI